MKRRYPESAIQKAVVRHLHLRGVRGLVWFHPANGGRRNVIEAANLKKLGVVPGVSDLILLHNGRMHALELKAEGGRTTGAQTAFQLAVFNAGGCAAIATGVDAALSQLSQWQLLR